MVAALVVLAAELTAAGMLDAIVLVLAAVEEAEDIIALNELNHCVNGLAAVLAGFVGPCAVTPCAWDAVGVNILPKLPEATEGAESIGIVPTWIAACPVAVRTELIPVAMPATKPLTRPIKPLMAETKMPVMACQDP